VRLITFKLFLSHRGLLVVLKPSCWPVPFIAGDVLRIARKIKRLGWDASGGGIF